MNQQPIPAQVEHEDMLLDRLVEQYLAAVALPGDEPRRLTPALFHRLYRAIKAEGYGR